MTLEVKKTTIFPIRDPLRTREWWHAKALLTTPEDKCRIGNLWYRHEQWQQWQTHIAVDEIVVSFFESIQVGQPFIACTMGGHELGRMRVTGIFLADKYKLTETEQRNLMHAPQFFDELLEKRSRWLLWYINLEQAQF